MTDILTDVVSGANEAIIVYDLGGRIISWNRGARKIYGYTETEALNLNIKDLLPPEEAPNHERIVRQIIDGADCVDYQGKRITKDGKLIDVWMTAGPVRDGPEAVAGIAAFERDVTGQSKLLYELETTLAMAEEFAANIEPLVAERTASLIALNIADRIINPVAVIGAISRQLAESGEIEDERIRNKLRVLLDESERLQQIVRDFNALTDNRRLVFESADLNIVAREAAMLVKKEAEVSGIALNLRLHEKPVMMHMNRNLLRTAIFYIFKNSIDATPSGGTIDCTTSSDEENAYLTVVDTGCGIPEENIGRIFDHFFTTKADRAGMGLPFVQFIVQEHFGDIAIENKPEGGAVCRMRFPLRWIRLSDGRLQWNEFILPMTGKMPEYPVEKKETPPPPSVTQRTD